jgi:hypothetical protein
MFNLKRLRSLHESCSWYRRSIPCFGDGSFTRFGGYTRGISGGYLGPNTFTFTDYVPNRCSGWRMTQEGFVPAFSLARQAGIFGMGTGTICGR